MQMNRWLCTYARASANEHVALQISWARCKRSSATYKLVRTWVHMQSPLQICTRRDLVNIELAVLKKPADFSESQRTFQKVSGTFQKVSGLFKKSADFSESQADFSESQRTFQKVSRLFRKS